MFDRNPPDKVNNISDRNALGALGVQWEEGYMSVL